MIHPMFEWHRKVNELRKAAGFDGPDTGDLANLVATLTTEELTEFLAEVSWALNAPEYSQERAGAIARATQEAVDIFYTVIQGLFYLGVTETQLAMMASSVTAANISKLTNGGVFREDGKLTKGPHYTREQLDGTLEFIKGLHAKVPSKVDHTPNITASPEEKPLKRRDYFEGSLSYPNGTLRMRSDGNYEIIPPMETLNIAPLTLEKLNPVQALIEKLIAEHGMEVATKILAQYMTDQLGEGADFSDE